MSVPPGKAASLNKNTGPADPHITPWEEEDEWAKQGPKPLPRRRGLREYVILAAAVLLVVYVISFLFSGLQTPSSSGKGGNFFFRGGSIALIPLRGEIVSGGSDASSIGFADVIAALENADNDPGISVIFLDIDSPGGTVVASKQIVSKIREMNKPVVSWIGEVGASGAYYAAAASDYILADADSLTGSIGVISIQPNVVELLQKIGVKIESIKTGELKDIASPYNELSEEERAVLQTLVEQAFEGFRNDVQTFRGEKLNPSKFQDVLDGRILSGKQALDVGLIDEVGTREEAIQKAAELGGIEGKPDIRLFYEREVTLRDLLFSAGTQFGKGLASGVNPVQTSENTKIEAK